MVCKKWWILLGAMALAAVILVGAVFFWEREEELPGGTLVKAVREVMACE